MKLSSKIMLAAKKKEERIGLIRRRRELRDTSNPFSINDARFQELFRFPKTLALDFIEELSCFLSQRRSINGLPIMLRILIAIRFFATGSYQRIVGDGFLLAVSQSSASRCIKEISNTINKHLFEKYIVFPQTTNELNKIKSRFYQQHGFPGIIGCIDGTHIFLKKPEKSIEHVYVCRKGGHSKNIQIVCDFDLLILSINPKFGGTAHDAFIWKSSLLQQHLIQLYQSGQRNFCLLGDSGYPQQPWLMTPILNTSNANEDEYNVAHKSTRNCVERCIGVLKSRFRCLSRERYLCYSPADAGLIINACAVMHNIFIQNRIPFEETEIDVDIQEILDVNIQGTATAEPHGEDNNMLVLTEGRKVRDDLIREYFRVM